MAPRSGEPTKKKTKSHKQKVSRACLFCRRSHMSCDEQRPCARCIKRDIAHLCRDEVERKPSQDPPAATQPLPAPSAVAIAPDSAVSKDSDTSIPSIDRSLFEPEQPSLDIGASSLLAPSADLPQVTDSSFYDLFFNNGTGSNNNIINSALFNNVGSLNYDSNNSLGNETYGPGLSDFLKTLDDPDFVETTHQNFPSPFPTPPSPFQSVGASTSTLTTNLASPQPRQQPLQAEATKEAPAPVASTFQAGQAGPSPNPETHLNLKPADKNDRYNLAAADQRDGSRDERLARVIHAKFEAGLLKPYDYVSGYKRLMRWMDSNMTHNSKHRTLKTLSEFRPAFRAIASSLSDLDLVFIEEAFERLLLDYDRVFSTMGIPACLWRRTGEIYKGNKEFAELVGVAPEALRDGKLAIYELMGEESSVNYWEKYGSIAFNSGQKAVLTSCVLINQAITAANRKRQQKEGILADRSSEVPINCTFSFTVRRDSTNIPMAIVGNFLPY